MSILHNFTALNFLAVGAGAAFGAWVRWLLGLALNPSAPGCAGCSGWH